MLLNVYVYIIAKNGFIVKSILVGYSITLRRSLHKCKTNFFRDQCASTTVVGMVRILYVLILYSYKDHVRNLDRIVLSSKSVVCENVGIYRWKIDVISIV
mgnify:CR=1 FL=1